MVRRVIAFILVSSVIIFYVDKQIAMSKHRDHLMRAEVFKDAFNRNVQAGATIATVEEYLERARVKWFASVSAFGTFTEIRMEVASGRSPDWRCRAESVGVIAKFKDDFLIETAVAAWSDDCF